ncbi:MAG TPA: class I SAM-dependent methyltransferase [Terriglobales bacterium]|nr:class I SAM-dependent methyltransferase [Terriglobales bacterium]
MNRLGVLSASRSFAVEALRFLLDSTPERRRRRYGDVDYDWEYRVDTTSATVGLRDRLLGTLHSPYQPTEPTLFHEMLGELKINFSDFTFLDLGSGKGRVLLMAAEYPFKRIMGVELLPELNRTAQENLSRYKADTQKCFNVETMCGDARHFVFPAEPTVLYLFNPLQESGLRQMIGNLERSLEEYPRRLYVLYHNPLLAGLFSESRYFRKIGGTGRYVVYSTKKSDDVFQQERNVSGEPRSGNQCPEWF